MLQTVQVGNQIIELDSEKEYFFTDEPDEEEKLFRKALSLPVKKQIVYYKDKHNIESAIKVVAIRLPEMYEITDRWYTCEILLCDDIKVRIHSAYLAEMQKPDFVFEVNKQEE